MKIIFFLIISLLSLSLLSIPDSFAQITNGINYDDQLIRTNPDGSEVHKWTNQPERILINNSWQDSRFTDDPNFLLLETGHGTIKLNKSTCSFDFFKKGIYDPGDLSLFSDSIVAKMANNGTEAWNEINSISSASCQTYGSDYQLVAKKYIANVGFIEYKYINTGSTFKTQLEATNLSTNTNKKFGFTQTINLNRDSINWGKSTKNLDDYNNTSFDRNWLENHESKVLNLLNNISINLELSFDKLESVYVLDNGINKSKLSFNYLYNAKIILPNDTLIIDPTFSSNNPSVDGFVSSSQIGATCSATASGKNTGTNYIEPYLATSGNTECQRGFAEFDITTIPNTATITDSHFKFDNDVVSNPRNCDFVSMTSQPTTATNQQIWDAIGSGTVLVSNDNSCITTANNYDLDLGASGDSYITTQLTSDWASIGIKFTDESRGGSAFDVGIGSEELGTATPTPTLEIIYSTVTNPDKVTDLTTTAIGQTTASLDWTSPSPGSSGQYIIGYQINVTTPQTNNPLVFLNDTGSTNSFYDLTGLTLGTSYSARVSAWANVTAGHPLNNATGNVYNFTTTTFIPPDPPTLSALSESDSAVRFTSINGTTNDFNMFYYGLRCELNNAGGWLNTVSNSTTPDPRIYSYGSLTQGDSVTCQWRDGSLAGFSDWSNNATGSPGQLGIIQEARSEHSDPLMDFATWIEDEGGLYFGFGVFPMVIMLIGFMATKATVRIFTIISLSAMGILHASGYFVYPAWYWTLALLFGIVLVLGRQARD